MRDGVDFFKAFDPYHESNHADDGEEQAEEHRAGDAHERPTGGTGRGDPQASVIEISRNGTTGTTSR